MNAIKSLIRGNKLFRKYHYIDYKEEVHESIRNGQKPQTLFISCCDSRITPDLMLGSKPGELFVLRNIGNFVPPFCEKGYFHGTASAIEYALSVLKVKNIIGSQVASGGLFKKSKLVVSTSGTDVQKREIGVDDVSAWQKAIEDAVRLS